MSAVRAALEAPCHARRGTCRVTLRARFDRLVSFRPHTQGVPVTVDLPAPVLARLRAEAAGRGMCIDQVIAELADQLPLTPRPGRPR